MIPAAAGIPVDPILEETDCEPHPPIEITEEHGTEGFTWTDPATGETEPRPGSGVRDGSGTSEDPYLIEGWCIHVPATEDGLRAGIEIEGTKAHVEVQSNVVTGNDVRGVTGTAGLLFEGTRHVTATVNTATGHTVGAIVSGGATQTTLEDNQLAANTDDGLRLLGSDANTVMGNEIRDNGDDGIFLNGADENRIEANLIQGNEADGIRSHGAVGNKLVNNTISGGVNGIALAGSFTQSPHATLVEANTVTDTEEHGIRTYISDGNTFRTNEITGAGGHAIWLAGSHHNQVEANTVEANENGIGVSGSGFYRGSIVIGTVHANSVEANVITDNRGNGTWVGDNTNDTQVISNTLTGNGNGTGVHGITENTTIARNAYHENGDAIAVTGTFFHTPVGVTVEANDLVASEGHALRTDGLEEPVMATGNWWGHDSGPSGGVADACTDATADGEGGQVSVTSAGACFDPWRTQPVPDAGAG